VKAVVQDRYGPPDVLRIEDVERPVPGPGEILIRVRATTVTQTDVHLRAAKPAVYRLFAGLRRPTRWRSLGVEFAGEVAEVGPAVSEFREGDRVFGSPDGFAFGCHAEYICLPQTAPIALIPAGTSFEEAAAVPDGFFQAIAALRAADAIGGGRRVLVYGASGSLGTAAVQLAKHFGAHVTAVTSAKNVDLVRALGADEVIDYTREDFTRSGERYDAIIDAVGKYSSFRGRRALRPGAIYAETDGGRFMLETFAAIIVTRWGTTRRVKGVIGRRSKPDLLLLRELMEAGEFRAVIDSRYPLEQVADAHRRVETWHKVGNVVLTLAESDQAGPRPGVG
jgi:NADPH:quinone reductase-like Zn-dependent oxidoreductase